MDTRPSDDPNAEIGLPAPNAEITIPAPPEAPRLGRAERRRRQGPAGSLMPRARTKAGRAGQAMRDLARAGYGDLTRERPR